MTEKTLTEYAIWLNSLGYLAEPDEPRNAVVVLTADGPQFITRAMLEDTPVAESITTILPLPDAAKIAEVRAQNVAALRQALEEATNE
jgi:hypothetical protein